MIYPPRGKQSSLKLRGDLALASLLFADEGSKMSAVLLSVFHCKRGRTESEAFNDLNV